MNTTNSASGQETTRAYVVAREVLDRAAAVFRQRLDARSDEIAKELALRGAVTLVMMVDRRGDPVVKVAQIEKL